MFINWKTMSIQMPPRPDQAASQPLPPDELDEPLPPMTEAKAPERVFTWEEIQKSGLLGADLVSALDEQLASLWADDAS